jgi:general secretion pathway protein D
LARRLVEPERMRVRLIGLLMLVPLLARAAPELPGEEKGGPPPAIDESLYSCKNRTADVVVTLKPETELKDLVTWVVGFTCKEFVFDSRIVAVTKKVNVVAPNKLTAAEAYQLFLVALSTVNLTVVPKGRVLRIVDAPTGKTQVLPVYQRGMPDATDQLIRYVLRPEHTQVDTLSRALMTFKSDAGDMQAVGSILVITDYASKVREMLQIAKLIDVPNGTDAVYTIPVRYADASKLVAKLDPFLSQPAAAAAQAKPGDQPAVPSKLMVDERTNTIIVAASDAAYQRVRALVERIDIPVDTDGGNAFHVVALANAKAEELAQTLTQAITGQAPTAAGGAKTNASKPATPVVDNLGASLEGQVRVIGDKASNSLLVVSSGRDFLAIRSVIADLDQPRRQVYIEAMIVEVNLSDEWSVGASGHLGDRIGKSGSFGVGGIENGTTSTLGLGTKEGAQALAGATGLLGALIGKTVNVLGQTVPSYAVLFQASANDSHAKILSAPSLIAVDNGKASSKIGIEVPYVKGLSIGGLTGGSQVPGSLNQDVERRPLLLALEIQPHITAGDMVYMDITHNAEDLGDKTDLGPIFTKREIVTSAIVHDQQTIVIGGLMQEREIKTVNKVPLLGDVPILGYLFKSTGTTKRKSNLLILVTPYIVKDQLDLQMLKERKLREQEEFLAARASLEDMPYHPHMNYGRKRGLVEEINRSVRDVDDDVAARKALEATKPPSVTPGPVEVPKE